MLESSHRSNPSSITSQYACWFDDRINQFISEHKERFEPSQQFKRRNGFFITISFDQNARSNRHENAAGFEEGGEKSELDRFSDLYNLICRQMMGSNYHRRSFDPVRPLAIGCLDMNGSRYWKSMGELENPHVHSIWILTDEIRERFQELITDEKRIASLKERLSIRDLDIQALDDDRRNSSGESRVSSYTAKFIGHNNHDLKRWEDFRILPLQRHTILN